jgi:hypothetical protein
MHCNARCRQQWHNAACCCCCRRRRPFAHSAVASLFLLLPPVMTKVKQAYGTKRITTRPLPLPPTQVWRWVVIRKRTLMKATSGYTSSPSPPRGFDRFRRFVTFVTTTIFVGAPKTMRQNMTEVWFKQVHGAASLRNEASFGSCETFNRSTPSLTMLQFTCYYYLPYYAYCSRASPHCPVPERVRFNMKTYY